MKNNLPLPTKTHRNLIRTIIEAVTYRTPLPVTRVIIHLHGNSYPVCPRCARSMEREYMSFCDRCGQKLNWELFEHTIISRQDHKKD